LKGHRRDDEDGIEPCEESSEAPATGAGRHAGQAAGGISASPARARAEGEGKAVTRGAPGTPAFTKTDQEAIILNSTWEMIDDMVNYEMVVKTEKIDEITLSFRTSSHLRLFNILLGDFLSKPRKWRGSIPFDLPEAPRQNGRESDQTSLFYLRRICEQPELSDTADTLRESVEQFAEWLEAKAFVPKVWLPSVDIELDVEIKRIVFIGICGNIGKHNFVRLDHNVGKVRDILAEHGHSIHRERGYEVLSDFYEWFHTHVFSYHASTIAEFLNNLRWAMFNYLEPEYLKSFHPLEGIRYGFDSPPECSHPFGRSMYCDLMNRMRSRPFFPRFTVDPYLKRRY
jgi:hypothetical protein